LGRDVLLGDLLDSLDLAPPTRRTTIHRGLLAMTTTDSR